MQYMPENNCKPDKNKNPWYPILLLEIFQQWRIDFVGPIAPPISCTQNWYIIIATDYTSKWIEARALKDNTTKSTIKFLYEEIIIHYGCPLGIVSDQGVHFINKTIQLLII